MQKVSLLLLTILLMNNVYSQKEKFDIASFIPPQGWQRIDSNGTLAFQDFQTTNNLTSFCQIILYPGKASSGNAIKDFNKEWSDRITKPIGGKAKPASQSTTTPDGWTVVTGTAPLTVKGITYTCILVTASGFGKIMSVRVNTAGRDYAATIDKFFNDLDLDNKAAVAINPQSNIPNNQTNMNGRLVRNDYDFIAPEGWQVQNNKDHIQVQNRQSGCTIRILDPQPSSGSLEQDAKAVFEMMYNGWQYQKTGEQKYNVSKGFLPKGLEYCMMEAGMSKLSADGSRYDGFEEGAALIVKAGAHIVIISVRHNTSLMAHNDCERKYETWRRFFNSFTVKNAMVPKNTEDPHQRIIGRWTMTEAGASGEYVFAANGNYAFVGALGTTSTSSDDYYKYLHIKTYAFQGDGSYSISGNQLTKAKRGVNNPERVQFRFEKVNKGGTGWNDRLYLLSKNTLGENEVCYEKNGE